MRVSRIESCFNRNISASRTAVVCPCPLSANDVCLASSRKIDAVVCSISSSIFATRFFSANRIFY
jgi:hypothetical protein